jgi:3-dehydroquinate synthase
VSTPTRIRVGGGADGSTPYDVVIGRGLVGELPGLLGEHVRRVGIVHARSMRASGEAVRDLLSDRGLAPMLLEVPDAEEAKTAEVATACWSALGRAGFTRSDAIVGLGGGATTDLAGFVAATWLRGVRVVHLPTTLLGMVDAAVGGKTGINTAEGKNLVGSFHAPAGVLCDLDVLTTLPRADLVSGLAEVVKCGFVADPAILTLVETDPAAVLDPTSAVVRELVERAVQVKATVVTDDLRETGGIGLGRELVNYGHTFGHAVERVEHYGWRHGDAVAVGMVYVAELARLAGRLDASVVARHRSVLTGLGLPTTYVAGRWTELHDAMRMDKKSRGDRLRFVVLDDVARPGVLESPDPALLEAAYAEVQP